MGYYVIKFVSEAYTLQDDTEHGGKISSADEVVVKAQYLRCMQENTNWYLEHRQQKQVIIVPTRTIVQPSVKDVNDIHRSVYNRNQK